MKGEGYIKAHRSTIILSALLLILFCCSLFVGVIEVTPEELLTGDIHTWEIFISYTGNLDLCLVYPAHSVQRCSNGPIGRHYVWQCHRRCYQLSGL